MESVKKTISVTVFGVLNILFGGLGLLLSTLIMLLQTLKSQYAETYSAYKIWLFFINIVGFGFSIWLIVLGIGLLRLKIWARRGSILYACLGILLPLIKTGVNFLAIFLNWTVAPQGVLPAYIVGSCIGCIGGLIYPVLLLIFMQTVKIRQAFQNPISNIAIPD